MTSTDGRARPAGSFRRAGLVTYGSTGLVVALSLVTGVLIARTLGAVGRGELTAIITAPIFVAWVGALGCSAAVTYHQSQNPGDTGRLLGTWTAILVPAAVVSLIVGELLIPKLLAAQTAETVMLAQLFMLTVVLIMATEMFIGVVWGDQDFGFGNLLRVTPAVILAVAYTLLWMADTLTVVSAVVANVVVAGVLLMMSAGRVLRRHPFGRPDLALGKTTLWYGVRAHGDSLASITNTRLDLLIMPAFLGAASVGIYSVAANVAGVILAVCGSLADNVMPAAARRQHDAPALVVASLQVTLLLAGGLAAGIALIAGPAVTFIYGSDFAGSVTPLRLLLPGVVLMAGASVIAAGLYAMNRPFTAFAAQLVGMAVTVPGLIIFLPIGGPTAAALVSTFAYATVFAVVLTAYLRATHVRARDIVTAAPWLRTVLKAETWRAS